MHVISDQHHKAAGCFLETKIIDHKAVANGLVGQVLARPLFLKVKQNSILQKPSNKQKYARVIFGLI